MKDWINTDWGSAVFFTNPSFFWTKIFKKTTDYDTLINIEIGSTKNGIGTAHSKYVLRLYLIQSDYCLILTIKYFSTLEPSVQIRIGNVS